MATVTVSASTTLALLGHGLDDDIVGTGAATLTCDSNPNALPAIRSIRSSSPRFTFKVRNSATAFSAGNLWKLSFTNPGSAIGSGQATLGFTGGATMDFEGEWLECYTATGVASETVLDASNVLGVDIDFPYFIEAETAVGSGVYKAVPVAVIGTSGNGYLTTVAQSAFGTGDVGRVLFYDHATRLLKTGDGTNGSLFASGIKFRIPNIYIHMPAFTMAVAAGGWTTATGAQNVVSSTNAPTAGGGNISYTLGSEAINITGLPSGTSVTVGTRSGDGTTAAAHAAGVLMYALPNTAATMAGKVQVSTNGIFKARCVTFGRWLMAVTNQGAQWEQTDVGFVGNVGGSGHQISQVYGLTSLVRGVVYANPGRGNQFLLTLGSQAGEIFVDGVLNVSQASTVSTNSFQSNNQTPSFNLTYSLQSVKDLRVWKLGITTGMTSVSAIGPQFTNCTPASGVFDGLELVGVPCGFLTSNLTIKNFRYSQTNGALSTASSPIAIALGSGGQATDVVLYDFDVLSGGVAPYGSWFNMGSGAIRVLIHNKISGTPRTVDCQSRTSSIFNPFDGTQNTAASMTFTNPRGTSGFAGSFLGLSNTVRNARMGLANALVLGQGGLTLDFPAGPPNTNGISFAYADGGTFYAAPNAWPALTGGIYLGPVSREQDLDQYELTAGAYTNNAGDFFLETTGDIVLFKSPKRITGVSSVTGGAVVYASHSSITTGVTAEFRLCKWGDDITAVSWASFTGGNVQTAFNALSGYTSSIGLDFQLRFTATTTVAGRYIRQCYVPVQMDTAYNPPVGTVPINVVGAAVGALAVLYDGSAVLTDTATIDAGGEATLSGPYDFDDVPVNGTLRVRAAAYRSFDSPLSWSGSTVVPASMPARAVYAAGPDTGVTFSKIGPKVTIAANMDASPDLWSRYCRWIALFANFDTPDSWTRNADGSLDLADWDIEIIGATVTGTVDTTGTATFTSGGAWAGGVLTAANGSTGLLSIVGAGGANVAVIDNLGAVVTTATAIADPYTFVPAFASTGTWTYKLRRYGYLESISNFSPVGITSAIEVLQADPGVSALEATAAAYTGISPNAGTKTLTITVNHTGQEVGDYLAWWIVQPAQALVADVFSYSGGVLNLGDWDIVVDGVDLTGDLVTTGDASQVSGGRFIGVVQAGNGGSGVLTVTGLTAAQVYVQNNSAVQQDYQPSQTGDYVFPTPFGSSGTWRLVVNKQGYFPQIFDFDPQTSNTFAITLQLLRNPDGTILYQGGTYPEIACTFVTSGNMRIRFGVEVTLQKIVDATQQAYSTSAGMAWLAAGNAELTAAILSAGQFIFLPERSRLFGTALDAALASFAVSADGSVVDPATDFPIRYVQPPSVAGSAEEIAAAIRADQVTELLRIIELAKLHGLDPAAPLVVTPTTRTAGSITQSISTVGDEVTVTRTA